MATYMAALSRRLSHSLLSNPKSALQSHQFPTPFCTSTTHLTSDKEGSDLEDPPSLSSDSESLSPEPTSTKDAIKNHGFKEPQLENGLDMGIYKAIVVGRVGQKPIQKRLKSGLTLTMFSVGTGGMRNNRRPLENESPQEFAERSSIQWHRVCVYPERLGDVVMKHAVPGSILYLEGNLESKIFTDPITGIVRRIREVSIRRNCRIVFLSKGGDSQEPVEPQINGVRY
ncbi:single-stranded DNA-binding protein, mitochondrial [Humulus lupulus]|uniref:single-stranded DNA-binding protein, mitochondrial n=1 Tax=Humulus lupulus TaxID=3486 RepID=UPI002B4130A9|nr:single-stranded DNA-binding protein, mitochondrial [Humulus lupulus]